MRKHGKMSARVLAIVLSAMMTITAVPSAAFAAEVSVTEEETAIQEEIGLVEESAQDEAVEEGDTEEADIEEAPPKKADVPDLAAARTGDSRTSTKRTAVLDFANNIDWQSGCIQSGTLWTNESEKWSWDTNTKILTLNGLELENGLENKYGITLPHESQIIVNGQNRLSSKAVGILALGGLDISGAGTLMVNVQANSLKQSSTAIFAGQTTKAPLTVRDATLIFNNENTDNRAPSALDNQNDTIELTNAKVTISGFESAVNLPFSSEESFFENCGITITDSVRGINAVGSIKISGSQVSVDCTKEAADPEDNPVAISGGTVEIADSTVTASSDGDCGIWTPGTLTVDETSEVTASGYYAGLQSNGNMTLGGTVASVSSDDSGIYTKGTLTINEGASVTATGNKYCGINAAQGLAMDGTVIADGPKDVGIFTPGNITIGSTADITSTGKIAGIKANGSLSVNGAVVNTLSSEGVGIYAQGTMTFEGATARITTKGLTQAANKEPVLKDKIEATGGTWSSADTEVTYLVEDKWTNYAADAFDGGTGAQGDPYQIASPEQLALLALNTNNGTSYVDTYFKLEADIDLTEHRWVPIGTYRWEKGSANTINEGFTGCFDGNNKTISGLMVDERATGNNAGLFGYIKETGSGESTPSVKDLTIADAIIYATEKGVQEAYSGILTGYALVNDGKRFPITNVAVSGTITNEVTDGNYQSGGLVGNAVRVDFTNCTADEVTILGGTNVGGFVGNASDSTFTNCHAAGSISGSWSIGGFVGCSGSASINAPSIESYSRCSADVEVTGDDWRVGGFVGYLVGGNITNSISYGDVTSTITGFEPKAGGFVGENNGTIKHSYAEGVFVTAHPTIKAGGFAGYDESGTTEKCMFNKTINSTLSAISTVGTAGTNDIKAGTTLENKIGICEDILDGHHINTAVWNSDAGSHWNSCSVCTGKFNKVAHSFGSWIMGTGSKYRDCSVCQKRETVKMTLKSIIITTAPRKLTYLEGEKFSSVGMKVMVKYSEGTQKEITDFTVSPQGGLKLGQKSVTISYTDNGVKKSVTQEITVNAKVGTIFNGGIYRYQITNGRSNGKGTVTILGFAKGKSTPSVTVGATAAYKGCNFKITAVGKNAFRENKQITTVKVGYYVKEIGYAAFYKCSNLKSVYLGGHIEKLGTHLFCHDKAIRDITINTKELTAKNVGEHALYALNNVKVKVPASKYSSYKKIFSNMGQKKVTFIK